MTPAWQQGGNQASEEGGTSRAGLEADNAALRAENERLTKDRDAFAVECDTWKTAAHGWCEKERQARAENERLRALCREAGTALEQLERRGLNLYGWGSTLFDAGKEEDHGSE